MCFLNVFYIKSIIYILFLNNHMRLYYFTKYRFFLFSSLLFIIFSCKKPVNYDQIDEEIILQYIAGNNLNAQPTGSGLYYVIENQGNGSQPNLNSTVTVAYVGKLTDGTIFDQSSSLGATFLFQT